jgi:hypothetical protein
MACDKTDLYFLDVADGAMKKYDLSVPSMGAALTAPTAGYYVGDNLPHAFVYSDGNIYLLSPQSVVGGLCDVFQQYSIAGNTWTAKTIPDVLRITVARSTVLIVDPDDDTYFYFWYGTDAGGGDTVLIKYTLSTQTYEIIGSMADMKPALVGDGALTTNRSLAPNAFSLSAAKRAGALDISNGDIVGASAQLNVVCNFGTKYGMQTILNYMGSGFFLGTQAGVGMLNYSADFLQSDVTLYITIDGGAERQYSLRDIYVGRMVNEFKIPFSTSIVIKALSGFQQNTITTFLNITS